MKVNELDNDSIVEYCVAGSCRAFLGFALDPAPGFTKPGAKVGSVSGF